WSFVSIAVGFIVLGFFNAFLNAGSTTFFQNNVPVEVMGRVTSIFQLIQSSGQVIFILFIGIMADLVSLRLTIVVLALLMFIMSMMYSYLVLKKEHKLYFK